MESKSAGVIRVRAAGAARPQAADGADGDRDRARRRDGQRHVRPHRLDRQARSTRSSRDIRQGSNAVDQRQVRLRPLGRAAARRRRRSTSRCSPKVRELPGRRRGRGQRRRRGAADRQGRQGDRLRRRAEPRLLDRERRLAASTRSRSSTGAWPGGGRGRRRRVDRRQGGLQARRDDRRPGRRARPAAADLRDRRVRLGLDDRRRDARRLRPPDRAAALRQARASSTRSRSPRKSGRQRPSSSSSEIQPILPPTTAGADGRGSRRPSDAEDTNEFISFLQTFLLAFGGIALFVGSFVIANSLSITIAQRTREFATLRTLGASRRQVLDVDHRRGARRRRRSRRWSGSSSGSASPSGLFWLFDAVGFTLPNNGPPLRDPHDRRRRCSSGSS